MHRWVLPVPLPPQLCALGVSPNHAANWRPNRNSDASGTAAMALAVMGSRRPSNCTNRS